MLSQSKNRVQAIKSKFENLSDHAVTQNGTQISLKHKVVTQKNGCNESFDKENTVDNCNQIFKETHTDISDGSPKPNTSYLYSKTDVKHSLNDTKRSLSRQCSDPGKKLHRSHAFRCDRSQKIVSPKRGGSCYGRSESGDFILKMGERKLSKDRLKHLGNFLEDQMRKENFSPNNSENIVGNVSFASPEILPDVCPATELEKIPIPDQYLELELSPTQILEAKTSPDSIPDSEVPPHILDQYAKVIKTTKKDDKHDAMTDSGVSSETENLEEEKFGRIKKLVSQFEEPETDGKTKSNSGLMNGLCVSSETMRLERKNPHLILTDTLKKALKQPLPPGPPPKKPPRTFAIQTIQENVEKPKKDTKKMLEKLEQVLQKREEQKVKNEYDEAESDLSLKKRKDAKEIHYLCTEIFDITNRTLLPTQLTNNCFKSLNCAMVTNNSTLSLPYSGGKNRNSQCCSCSNENFTKERRFSTFLGDQCSKCSENAEKSGFKCHINCKCRSEMSNFYVDEHIYDVPFVGDCGSSKSHYGMLKTNSKSLEELWSPHDQGPKIYDVPCDVSRPETPVSETPIIKTEITETKPKSEFEKLRQNFENGFAKTEKSPKVIKPINRKSDNENEKKLTRPPMKPKPLFVKNKFSKSTENMVEVVTEKIDKRFSTEVKKKREMTRGRNSVSKKDATQLDVDRENLNRLMNEIYDTVTAACNMENKPGSFPTDHSDGSTSEDSVKLTRSLTDKRKNYVRRVSSRVAYLDQKHTRTRFRHQTSVCSYKSDILQDNPYNTFRSWKSFRTSQSNLTTQHNSTVSPDMSSKCNLTDSQGNSMSMSDAFDSSDGVDKCSIDEKTGCLDIELPFEPRLRGLFNVCLLVGLNYMKGEAYVKSVFPSQVQVPPHIENLIFPETMSDISKREWTSDANRTQCYSLVLTDERGERSYGYCRRVLPEGATVCLPLCYCLIGKYRAPGFYYKVLQEIESHHGRSDTEIHSVLQQLFDADFPNPGEEITVTSTRHRDALSVTIDRGDEPFDEDAKSDKVPIKLNFRNSVVSNEASKCRTMPNMISDDFKDFYGDFDNNNGVKKVLLSFDGTRLITIKRPIEPRVDELNLSVLLDTIGAGLAIKVFGSLLLERKVLIIGDQLSQVSSCIEALQTVIYPFVWQQPLISTVPSEIQRDILQAPLPILAGGTAIDGDHKCEEGMLIDLTHPLKVLSCQGDESTILPTPSYKTLKTTLQMEAKNKDDSKTRNVMISEAFLRFFVDILGDFWRFFSEGEVGDGLGKNGVVFDKESFIKSATSKQNQYFLEWFTETAMFNHFIQNMAVIHKHHKKSHESALTPTNVDQTELGLVDTPLPDYYGLFLDRLNRRTDASLDGKNNYKIALNRRVKLLKTKLRELVA